MVKVIVYDKNTKKGEFTGWGYGKLRYITSCKVYEELNGRFDVELIVSLLDSKAKYLTKWAIISINGQLFRITDIVKSDKDKSLKVFANHIFYDLNYGFIEDSKADGKTLGEALVIGTPTEFNYFTPTSDIKDKNNLYFVKDTGVSSVFRAIERWGKGELVRDNFNYAVNLSKGKDKGVTFTYKKVDGIEITEETDEVVTRLFPTGKDGIKLAERYIDIPNWNDVDYPPFHITREVAFEEAENEGDLRFLAKEKAKEIGLSKTNFKIQVQDLLYTELYKSVPELMRVEVGDIVTIKHSSLNLRVKVKVIKKEIDYITKKVNLELGQPLANFFKSVDNSKVKVEIPSLDRFKEGLFYYSNGLDISVAYSKKEIASVNFGATDDTNLVLYVNVFVNVTSPGLATFKMVLDNHYLDLEPKVNVAVGHQILSFTYPLLSVKGGVSHSFILELETDGGIQIAKECVQVMIKGQDVSGGMGAELPKIDWIETINYLDNVSIINEKSVSQTVSLGFEELLRDSTIQVIPMMELNGNIGEQINISLTRSGDVTDFNKVDSNYLEFNPEFVYLNGEANLIYDFIGAEGNYSIVEDGNLYSMNFLELIKYKNVESVEVIEKWE